MARRKSKAKPRSRSKPKLNLIDTGVSLLIANSVSQNVAGIGIYDFLFAGSSFSDTINTGYVSGGGNHKQIVTLREIFSGNQIGTGITVSDALMSNLKTNAFPLAVAVVGIPMVAKVAKKALRTPVLTPMNRMLKMSGLGVKV
tara:strand:+ start:228 stop:656 length:429 start_codon:yes stop_codon:yes gene_type:complete